MLRRPWGWMAVRIQGCRQAAGQTTVRHVRGGHTIVWNFENTVFFFASIICITTLNANEYIVLNVLCIIMLKMTYWGGVTSLVPGSLCPSVIPCLSGALHAKVFLFLISLLLICQYNRIFSGRGTRRNLGHVLAEIEAERNKSNKTVGKLDFH